MTISTWTVHCDAAISTRSFSVGHKTQIIFFLNFPLWQQLTVTLPGKWFFFAFTSLNTCTIFFSLHNINSYKYSHSAMLEKLDGNSFSHWLLSSA